MKLSIWVLLFSAPALAASSDAIEPLVLRGDWPVIAAMVHADPASATAVEKLALRAHAFLAANDVNSALCGFAAISPAGHLAWERWTSAMVRKAPDSATAHYLHGDALARVPRFAEAIAEFNRALAADPRSSLARNARGVVLALSGRYDEALMDYAKVSAADPAFVDARINRGYLYVLRSGSAASQIKAFNEALKIRPGAILAIIGEGRALAAAGSQIAGVQEIDQAPRSCKALDVLAGVDRSTLFAWVRAQDELQKSRTMAYAGMTLNSALRDIEFRKDIPSVLRAFDIAAQSSDPRAKEQLSFTLRSMEVSPDKQLASVVGQALTQERALIETQRENLKLQDSQKYQFGGSISGQLQRGIGVDVKASMSGDLKTLADYRLQQLDQKDHFLQDLNSKLPSPGGAETFQLGVARIDKGDAPRVYHNTLMYLEPLRHGEESK